jgi:hypothetical protein
MGPRQLIQRGIGGLANGYALGGLKLLGAGGTAQHRMGNPLLLQ